MLCFSVDWRVSAHQHTVPPELTNPRHPPTNTLCVSTDTLQQCEQDCSYDVYRARFRDFEDGLHVTHTHTHTHTHAMTTLLQYRQSCKELINANAMMVLQIVLVSQERARVCGLLRVTKYGHRRERERIDVSKTTTTPAVVGHLVLWHTNVVWCANTACATCVCGAKC